MNLVGRQMQRTGGGTTTTTSSSNDFIEIPSKWLQSAALPQDYMMYGAEGGGGMKWNDKSNNNSRNMQRSMNAVGGGGGGGISSNEEFPLDPPSPPNAARLMALRRAGAGDAAFSPREYSPGLLDLNSLDTELIREMSANGVFDEPSLNQIVRGKNLDDSEPYPAASRNSNRSNSVAKIKVVVRKRPLNKKEIAKKEDDIITTETNSTALTVHETKLKVDLTEYVERHGFVFDAVLDENVSNDEVYAKTVEPVVPLIFQKTKATCFAYGQTGSGKTYTMQPLPLSASRDILRLMHHTYRNQGYQLFVSFFEIYGGKLYDLLNDRKFLCMREDGKKQVCIVGLQEYKVFDTETILDLIQKGNGCRSTGTTGANEESSRSHAILQLVIKRSVDATDSKPPRVVGKLSFIDLAGSERGADTTDNDKQTRMEGAEINKSLLALKECIRALDNDQNHIPFRGSKLTEVLRDSFVGNSRTVMISCISPNAGSCEHTLNTLRYADRVKSLSKGNSKRDVSSSAPKDSQTLSSSSPLGPTLEESSHDDLSGSDRFGWSREYERETPPSPSIERVRSGRADNSSAFQYQAGGLVDMSPDDYIYSEDIVEQDSPSWIKNRSGEIHQMPAVETRARKNDLQSKLKDLTDFRANYASSDDDLNTLLKEEEDLVTAHRRLVEETIEIVREEMNMLVDADQPGNQLDDYISKLNSILSQKAAGILKLQNRLANFKRRLNEHNVLISTSGQ